MQGCPGITALVCLIILGPPRGFCPQIPIWAGELHPFCALGYELVLLALGKQEESKWGTECSCQEDTFRISQALAHRSLQLLSGS